MKTITDAKKKAEEEAKAKRLQDQISLLEDAEKKDQKRQEEYEEKMRQLMDKLKMAEEDSKRIAREKEELDAKTKALEDALEVAEQKVKDDERIVDPIDWEAQIDKIKADKNKDLSDKDIEELKAFGKILNEEDRAKMARLEVDKFASESKMGSFKKENEGGLSTFWLIAFSCVMLGGVAMLLYVIYQCGMDKAHPFEEMGGTRIYHESLVLNQDEGAETQV